MTRFLAAGATLILVVACSDAHSQPPLAPDGAPPSMTENLPAAVETPLLNGVLNACAHKQDGQLRLVGATEECRSSEFAVSWNVAGPQGEPGPPGAQGDPGPPGPSGLSGYEIVNGAAPAEGTTAIARCPPGKIVVGGGGRTNAAASGTPPPVTGSSPGPTGASWSLRRGDATATTAGVGITLAMAICVDAPQ